MGDKKMKDGLSGDHHKQKSLEHLDNDWLDGERDAKKGIPADPKRSENYQMGYGYRYGMLEMKSKGVF